MSKPWLLLSDLHCHQWSAFSTTLPDGMNSRLAMIIAEIERAAQELKAAGGDLIVLAGDLFHTRGSIAPEVFNPVYETFRRLCEDDFGILAIPGNHDLAGKETTELGNAMQSLGALDCFTVITEPRLLPGIGLAFIPWCSSYADLRKKADALATSYDVRDVDLIIHAGVNGVLMGMPDHGLDSAEVASWGYRRVFCGHYHNHKVMEDGKVVSIGALTHQTWSDVGTKAGFLLVTDESVAYRATQAPAFVDIDADTEEEDIPLLVDGNFVRIRGLKLTDLEVNQMRAEFERLGAKGIVFQTAKVSVSARTGSATPVKARTLTDSVMAYVDKEVSDHKHAVAKACEDILAAVTSA
jgi:DNA repair exonuclease SbcCD nuclease subunit